MKIERPEGGDPGRGGHMADGFHSYIEAFNRGKRSVTLDLRNPESKEIIHKLLEWADGRATHAIPPPLTSRNCPLPIPH